MKNRKGIALIMAVGILALLAVIATSFALNMRLEYKAAMNYYNGVKARYFAEAALQEAIARLKEHVKSSAFDYTDEPWGGSTSGSWTDEGTLSNTSIGTNGAAEVIIVDEQRKININNANSTLLGNLCDIREISSGIRTALTGAIGNFSQREDLKRVILDNDGTEADYEKLEPYITVYSYEDESTNRSPINLNTCESLVLESVLRGLSDGSGNDISSFEAESVAADIVDARPITSWSGFDSVIDTSASEEDITPAEATVIKNNCNPNRTNPSTSTTEFCFNSGGVYEITGTGTVGPVNDPIATRTVTAIVKIYDIYNQTTREQFRGEDVDYDGMLDAGEDVNGNGSLDVPTYQRVTWMDSCPVNASDLFGRYDIPEDTEYVKGALKIGYWDDFDEDVDYVQSEWIEPTHGFSISDSDSDGDNEICASMSDGWPTIRLQDASKWTWQYNTLRIFLQDDNRVVFPVQMQDVGWVQINGQSVLLSTVGVLQWSAYYYDIGGIPVCTDTPPAGAEKWIFQPRLRRFPYPMSPPAEPNAVNLYYCTGPRAFTARKTFNMINSSTGASATIWDALGGTDTITYPIGGASTLEFYAHFEAPYWDDLRIIPADGNYTSISYTPIGDDVEWGSIAFTGTEQTDTTISIEVDTGSGFNAVANDSPIGSTSSSIKYKVNFTSGANMQNTPILEDLTITYLLSTKILSWSGM